jgi:tetratricopeptide (TPR) repeat protein
VDETVVIDTGSSDRTREVAARFGARVFDFPWQDSFAAARNETLLRARGEWIFWLDADEHLEGEGREKLRELLARLPPEDVAYLMGQHSRADDGGPDLVVEQASLFRHHPLLRWEYRVHEQVLPALLRRGARPERTGVIIRHQGYQDPALRRRKVERNLKLLRLEDAEHPGDPFTLFNLGSVYRELGRLAEAAGLLRRSLERSPPGYNLTPRTYALLIHTLQELGQVREAAALCREARNRFPGDPELVSQESLLRQERGT